MKIYKIIILSFFCYFLIQNSVHAKGEKVRLGYLQNDLHHLACWIAIEKNFFKQEGVEVEVAGIFKAGPEEMVAFSARELDIGYVGEAPATMAVVNKTANVVVLAQVNKEGSAIVIHKDSDIKEISMLRGKSVAVPGHAQVQDFLLRKALDKNKMDVKDINIIVLKPPEMIGALRTHQVDAFIAWEPYPSQTITMGIGKILLKSEKIWKDHPCCVLIADKKFAEKNPEKIKSILRAHVKGTDFIREHPDETVQIAVRYTGMDAKTIRIAIKNIKYDYIPSIEGEIEYVNFLSKLGYIKVTNAKNFANKFIKDDILKEILRQ